MRRILFVLPLLAAACATPREACISQASSDLRTLNSLIAETQANIARGFTYVTKQEVITTKSFCELTNQDGSISTYPCDDVETIEHREPVAIDLNVEQAKLSSMIQRQKVLESQVNAAVQQCVATYPE